MEKIRLFIAEDNDLVRNKLITMLKIQGLEVVGEAANGQEALVKVEELKPDIVLMDLKMPKMNGSSACREIKKLLPETKVMVLTSFSNDELIQQAIEAGADGYLLKDIQPKELLKALKETNEGKYPLNSEVARKIVEKIKLGKKPVVELDLTEREMEVLELVAASHTNKEIALELEISSNTVKYHVNRIIKKVGKNDRIQTAIYAIEHGIVKKT
ncbi:response regulator transcription factor [Candidatus Oleimmundimicrobium sp.]|uniref:response regulator transcription factor n=1 Tax=Candidatus Oleimmundimicrobium sp. TaxID=3060597 RepID=UPI00271A47E1|nr:response regulator transcription factor [Candidatus Oleimmundimicrobium sp.]MDO8885497.1 response regulator transcription factor [Candidatus Oleimmundimicrobium sp.]